MLKFTLSLPLSSVEFPAVFPEDVVTCDTLALFPWSDCAGDELRLIFATDERGADELRFGRGGVKSEL